MQYAFIRHKCDSTQTILHQLWDERLIALHYENNESIDPSHYPSAGAKALKRLLKYCESGAIIGASYSHLDRKSILIGKIAPGSQIIAKTFKDPQENKEFIYKTVQLTNSKVVKYADYPLLAGIQPRLATITGWPSAKAVLNAAFRDTEIPRCPSNLHPSQLEVLCYEWLRTYSHLERLVMPIGRGLIDIDILGITRKGNRVSAQVTHSTNPSDLKEKEDRLLSHAAPDDCVFFFLPELNLLPPNTKVTQITFHSVLTDLQSSLDESIKKMLDTMFRKTPPHESN